MMSTKTEDQLWDELIDAFVKAREAKAKFREADAAFEAFIKDSNKRFQRAWLRGEL